MRKTHIGAMQKALYNQAMSGMRNLDSLIAAMEPLLQPETYVFVTSETWAPPASIVPRMTFQEDEGRTFVMTREQAIASGLAHTFPSRMITLNVHSSLEAVGFMASIASALAEKGISVNPAAGFFHDHLFVPEARAHEAMETLRELARQKGSAAE